MFCEQTCLISCVCTFPVITKDLKTNNVCDNVRGLDSAELLHRGFAVQVFAFEGLRVVQNHTVELCVVTSDSPEMIGMVLFNSSFVGRNWGGVSMHACCCPLCEIYGIFWGYAWEERWHIIKSRSTLKALEESLIGSLCQWGYCLHCV